MYQIKTEDFIKILAQKKIFGFSNYLVRFYDDSNILVVGKMEDD